MQHQWLAALLSVAGPAHAADYIWLSEPTEQESALLATVPDVGAQLKELDLRAYDGAWTKEDAAAYANLASVLKDVRKLETKLDGELIIMRDLERALDQIERVRSDEDRQALFAALTYQGFAVNRFFDTDLGTAPDAADYRVEVGGVFVERPWLRAAALDPEREVTAYEIAEAVQRVAYGERQGLIQSALPATIIFEDLPAGELVVDGRVVERTSEQLLSPGRHYAHVLRDGAFVASWRFDTKAGEVLRLSPALSDKDWQAFLNGLSTDVTPTQAVTPGIEALGGEVWFVRGAPEGLTIHSVTTDSAGSSVVAYPKERRDDSGFSALLGVQGGWLNSDDFYYQDPFEQTPTGPLVNALAVGWLAGIDVTAGSVRFGAGVDGLLTPGKGHLASSGSTAYRVRAIPHVSVGIPQLVVTGGMILPYHPAIGGRAQLPVGPMEIRAQWWSGLGAKENPDPTQWSRHSLHSLTTGLGIRL